MSFLNEKRALSREKRLGTLSNYNGSLEAFVQDIGDTEIKQRVRTFSQSYKDEVIAAIHTLAGIKNSVFIVNGSLGCAASALYYNDVYEGIHWYSTNLKERDTILGGDEKLRESIRRAYEERHPEVIFVVGTPVVAINNDDIASVILELEDELGIKIIHIQTDGFKTKTLFSGYDMVLHALLKYVVKSEKSESETVNLITLSDRVEDISAVTQILKDLDISYRILPQFADIKAIEDAASAKASIVLNPEEGEYLAEQLEEVYGVPYIRTEIPVGIRGTGAFIRKIADVLGIEEKAEKYINEKEKAVEEFLNSNLLTGKKIFLDIKIYSAEGFIPLIRRLGGEVSALAFGSIDLNNRAVISQLEGVRSTIPVMIANGQEFEKANIIKREEIDIYISQSKDTAFAYRAGAYPVTLSSISILAYKGIEELINRLRAAKRSITGLSERRASDRPEEIYTSGWLKRSTNWYVKKEVS
ncbi:MAG: nitrogenase component 1 [Lachnospiraceae bacterium]|nr:nitrogenase component 1 [Lachnospiraceae bacterium]